MLLVWLVPKCPLLRGSTIVPTVYFLWEVMLSETANPRKVAIKRKKYEKLEEFIRLAIISKLMLLATTVSSQLVNHFFLPITQLFGLALPQTEKGS